MLIPVRSLKDHQFLLASVTTSPPEIVLNSAIQWENQTSFPLTLSLTTTAPAHAASFTIQPLSAQPLPFLFSLLPFSIQLKPPSYDYCSPCSSASFVSYQTVLLVCAPPPACSAMCIANEWACECTRVPLQLSKHDTAVLQRWQSRFPELQTKAYAFQCTPLFTVGASLPCQT